MNENKISAPSIACVEDKRKTTEEVMSLVGCKRSTATKWAKEKGLELVILSSGKAGYAWSDDDIERFKKRPKRGRRW